MTHELWALVIGVIGVGLLETINENKERFNLPEFWWRFLNLSYGIGLIMLVVSLSR
jgi:hypothetical protein